MEKIQKEELSSIVGQRLKELRKATTDLGQKDVADAIGITKQALSSYESGRHLPEHATLVDLAKYYSCTTDYLYGLSDKMTHSPTNYSERNSVNQLLQSLDGVADDEGDYLIGTMTDIVNAVSLTKKNPKRRNFIESFGELFGILAEYVESSTISSNHLLQKNTQNNLTAEDVSIEATRFYGFDDLDKTIDDIKRTGFASIMSFSVNAKKALRIRTGWRISDKETRNERKKALLKKCADVIE